MRSVARRIVTSVVLISLLNILALSAQSPASGVASSKPKIILVELFTSEGCSDCPPADELLQKVDQKQTESGQLVVGISEHVTYWNYLGWSDPFSQEIYSQRQSAYGARFGLDSVYTPQMVVNGAEQFVGSDSAKLQQALRREGQQAQAVDVRIVSTSMADGLLRVTYSVRGNFPSQGVDIVAVLADDTVHSNVRRGENSGRNLTHVAVARSLTRIATVKAQDPESRVQLPLPSSFQSSQEHHLILFAQTSGNGRVLGADTKSF
jgi:hypothetical protein